MKWADHLSDKEVEEISKVVTEEYMLAFKGEPNSGILAASVDELYEESQIWAKEYERRRGYEKIENYTDTDC